MSPRPAPLTRSVRARRPRGGAPRADHGGPAPLRTAPTGPGSPRAGARAAGGAGHIRGRRELHDLGSPRLPRPGPHQADRPPRTGPPTRTQRRSPRSSGRPRSAPRPGAATAPACLSRRRSASRPARTSHPRATGADIRLSGEPHRHHPVKFSSSRACGVAINLPKISCWIRLKDFIGALQAIGRLVTVLANRLPQRCEQGVGQAWNWNVGECCGRAARSPRESGSPA